MVYTTFTAGPPQPGASRRGGRAPEEHAAGSQLGPGPGPGPGVTAGSGFEPRDLVITDPLGRFPYPLCAVSAHVQQPRLFLGLAASAIMTASWGWLGRKGLRLNHKKIACKLRVRGSLGRLWACSCYSGLVLIHSMRSLVSDSKQTKREWARAGHAQVTALTSQAGGAPRQSGLSWGRWRG